MLAVFVTKKYVERYWLRRLYEEAIWSKSVILLHVENSQLIFAATAQIEPTFTCLVRFVCGSPGCWRRTIMQYVRLLKWNSEFVVITDEAQRHDD